jgi:uncharacterized protein (DUF1501 family)
MAVNMNSSLNQNLVVIFLRGACDALNFVPPITGHDRKIYEQERPNLKMPLDSADGLLKLDERFGIHPKAKFFHSLFQEKKLAVIHAVGSPLASRSHFDAQNFMELGLIENQNIGKGWLTRLLEVINSPSHESAVDPALPALAAGPFLPTSLLGFEKAISVNDINRFNLGGFKTYQDSQQDVLTSLYASGKSRVHEAGASALLSLATLQKASQSHAKLKTTVGDPATPAFEYPKSEVANRLKTLAALMKLNLGLRISTVDMGGWDTHKFQGVGLDGVFAKQVEQLTEGLEAFWQDLQGLRDSTRVLVVSEFGRRLRENANRGTDHGHGAVFFLMGAGVKGGKVFGRWPGLTTENLFERADLAATTDYRQVFSEASAPLLSTRKDVDLFPKFKAMKGTQSLNLNG